MSIIKELLSPEYSSYIQSKTFSKKSIQNSHLPTAYESDVTETMNNFFKFHWCGKTGNTSATDCITKSMTALEIKGSSNLGHQQLNSTPLCKYLNYKELPAGVKQLITPNVELFPKEYLFFGKKKAVSILINPQIMPNSFETYSEARIETLEYFKNGHECEKNKNNKIVLNYDFNNKNTLKSKDINSLLTWRLRTMHGFELSKLLSNPLYNLSKDLINKAVAIVFTTPEDFNKKNLTNLSHLIHYQDNNLIILVNYK